MFGFFRSVVEAVLEKGVRGLLEEVPGGKYFCDVAERVCSKEKERRRQAKQDSAQHDEFEKIAQTSYEVARGQAEEAFKVVMAEHKVALSPEELEAGVQWVAAIPEATRTSLKRKEDPTGRSVPANFVLNTADDVLKVLPARPPRFSAGNRVPGRDEWVLERPLGVGGFGEVWLTRHTQAKGLPARAIKFCFDQTGRDLIHEADLIGRVMAAGGTEAQSADERFKHVVPMLDVRLNGDSPWLMFEYVAGGNLADWLHQVAGKPHEVRVPQVVMALKQLCRGVGVFHGLTPALVHRDLKPSNILLDKSTKRLRVTDFGIGAVTSTVMNRMESRGESTHGGRLHSYLRGSHTPTYSSPEQRRGSDPEPRDDVHALGVIGYQLLMSDLMAAPGPDMASDLKEKAVPEDLIVLLADCVARNPNRRPASAMELLTKLETIGRTKSVSPLIPETVLVEPGSPLTKTGTTRKGGETLEFPLPGGLKMAFCWIPPGTAQFGAPKAERDAAVKAGLTPEYVANEGGENRGTYTTRGFWLGKYPVTQAEWQAVIGENPSHFQTGSGGADKVKGLDVSRFPVESVSWDDCQTFLKKLNARGGMERFFGQPGQFALPHEDAWEYACRGGLGNQRAFYWGNELNGTQANCDGSSPFGTATKGPYLERPTPVGTYAAKFPHPWGLCDLHGNVWEWCENSYEQTDICVLRGGSWYNVPVICHAAFRGGSAPADRSYYFGFRVAFRLD